MINTTPMTFIWIALNGNNMAVFFFTVGTTPTSQTSLRVVTIGEGISNFIPSKIVAFSTTQYYIFGYLQDYIGTYTFPYNIAAVYQDPDLWSPSCISNAVSNYYYTDASTSFIATASISLSTTTLNSANPIHVPT